MTLEARLNKVMKNKPPTRYALMHPSLDVNHGLPIKAKSDLGAVRQGKKMAKEQGLKGYHIAYCRDAERGVVWIPTKH
jgi:hypothetical protein